MKPPEHYAERAEVALRAAERVESRDRAEHHQRRASTWATLALASAIERAGRRP